MSVSYRVLEGDVRRVPADLLLLKYAQGFHGADELVATVLDSRGVCALDRMRPDVGRVVVVETEGAIAAARVMFIGVPTLRDFRYAKMRSFAKQAIEEIAKLEEAEKLGGVRSVLTTVHGAGYGLDVEESLQAMVLGFQVGAAEHPGAAVRQITFVEKHPRRVDLLTTALREIGVLAHEGGVTGGGSTLVKAAPPTARSPVLVEKKTAFVAMPFAEEFEDVYEFGIYAPIRRCGYACEKVDVSAFAGDIVMRIQEGIREARFVVADLTGEKPNVYLEVGYAWGLGKPVLLLAREGEKLHFDLSHHKCVFYKTIGRLAADLERHVRELYGEGSSP